MGLPAHIDRALEALGYEPRGVGTGGDDMAAHIEDWWGLYTASASWYDRTETSAGRKWRTRRMTLHPARRVCREWASLILDDDGTRISAPDDETADGLLSEWVAATGFLPLAQRALERGFALGTAAIVLGFDVRDGEVVAIRPRRCDARNLIPLTWDESGITELAVLTRINRRGHPLDQLQVISHDGTYRIVTRLFDGKGREVSDDGVIDEFDTGTDAAPFAVISPALDNVCVEGTPLGQSVFADAVDAIKAVDTAWDSIQREVEATKVKVFMTDDLLDNIDGEVLPMSPDSTVIRKLAGNGSQQMLEVFAPAIRIEELRRALDTALAELGETTGFDKRYFAFDGTAGIRTATEVISDNSAVWRTLRKHEVALAPQLSGLMTCMLECSRVHMGAAIGDSPTVTIDFDDSIITDTNTERQLALSEIAAMPEVKELKRRYLVRFLGMTEEDAAVAVPDSVTVTDGGW